MGKKVLIRTGKTVYNRQFLNISKDNFKIEINKDDNIFISENGVIQTIWKLYKKGKKIYRFEKIKVIRNGCRYEELETSKLNKKEIIINIEIEEDKNFLDKIFEHKLKLYPQYNIKEVEDKDKALIKKIKIADPKIEFYYNAIMDNGQKVSLAIIPNYGVVIVENFKIDTLGKIETNNDIVLDKLIHSKRLYKDKELEEITNNQILLTNSSLNINYMKYIVCEELTGEQIDILNIQIRNKTEYLRFVNIETLINKMIEFSKLSRFITDEIKTYGIKCSLMPQYIIKKSCDVFSIEGNGKLKIPQTVINLDDEQIRILDELNERTYIESTAGTGKSVILLTKAYMMAIENPQKEFIYICFNNKLSQEIELEAGHKNRLAENLKILTFDKFIKENFHNSNNFIENHQIFIEMVNQGRFSKRYGGIFIDEAQQLEDEWKIALYDLLDENKYMILVGDYNQEIRNSEIMDKDNEIIEFENDNKSSEYYYLGDARFKRITMDKNYRNTIEITYAINNLVKKLDHYKKEINYTSKKENKEELRGISVKNGRKPEYIFVSKENEEKEIIKNKLYYLIEGEKIQQEDIILLYPGISKDDNKNKTCGRLSKYAIKNLIKELGYELNDLTDGYSNINDGGIKFSTIGKSIGLDFKAVIIFGLNNIKDAKSQNFEFTTIEKIKNASIDVKKEFIGNLKNIYVAASRAKEYLYIIDDIEGINKNMISEFVKKIGE